MKEKTNGALLAGARYGGLWSGELEFRWKTRRPGALRALGCLLPHPGPPPRCRPLPALCPCERGGGGGAGGGAGGGTVGGSGLGGSRLHPYRRRFAVVSPGLLRLYRGGRGRDEGAHAAAAAGQDELHMLGGWVRGPFGALDPLE